ncbi:MAG: hypothetical protein AMK73_00875 [Planctomycetes bacterium SM23_32]|nr:MAG: hypothetical protein AMK73_00875 [Planctomycetes bacterium SM23_32]
MTDASGDGRERLLKGHRVQVLQEAVQVPVGRLPVRQTAPEPSRGDVGEPEVQMVRADDGTIQQITIRCTCGRQTTLQCEYLTQGDADEKHAS